MLFCSGGALLVLAALTYPFASPPSPFMRLIGVVVGLTTIINGFTLLRNEE